MLVIVVPIANIIATHNSILLSSPVGTEVALPDCEDSDVSLIVPNAGIATAAFS